MKLRRPQLLAFALFLVLPAFCLAQQAASEDIFTISVNAPTLAKDVQARYLLTDDAGKHLSNTTTQADGNNIVVKGATQGKSPRSLKAILYAPGCQFVTISVDDLSSNRQAEFQCQKLSTVELRGKAAASALAQPALAGKTLQLESLYVCSWAQKFFGISKGAISPFALRKASVDADGSFTVELPDFSSDPTWASLSHDAGLMFYLGDSQSGQRLATLAAPAALSHASFLQVAPSYPEIEFTIQPQKAGKQSKVKQ